jgi:HD-GYP domain-containing protein (c-di-GMP phosphodiesterase class II)
MAQVLLVSDNEVLNGIYSVNFDVYLGTSMTVVDDLESAKKLMELNPNFQIIITLCLIEGQDCGVLLRDHLKQQQIDTPLMVIGRQSEVQENEAVILPASYNIKSLLRSAAKILGTTARDMAEREVPEYFPVSTKIFFNISTVPCDIFYKVKKTSTEVEYLLILTKNAKVWPRIKKYIDEGATTLYLPSSYRAEFANNASEQILKELETLDLPTEDKVDAIEKGIELVTAQYLSSAVASENVVKLSNACVKAMGEVATEYPKIRGLLKTLIENKSGYLYAHSILATYVANHIVREISWGGESHIEKLNFVMFFHDIFLVPIYAKFPDARFEEDLMFSDKLSDGEKEIVLNHAKLACESVKKFPRCPMGADQLILQHHGATNGVGFAVKYKDDISPLAKVILIAEHFVEEIFRLGDDPATSFNKNIVLGELKTRYAKSSYNKILDTLANIEI